MRGLLSVDSVFAFDAIARTRSHRLATFDAFGWNAYGTHHGNHTIGGCVILGRCEFDGVKWVHGRLR